MGYNLAFNLNRFGSTLQTMRWGTFYSAVEPPKGTLGTNIFTNPNFETFTGSQDDGVADTFTGWSKSETSARCEATADAQNGTNAVKLVVTAGSGKAIIYQAWSSNPNAEYQLEFYAKGDGVNEGTFLIRNSELTGTKFVGPTGVKGTTYQRVVKNFRNNEQFGAAIIYFQSSDVNGAVAYYDNISLKQYTQHPSSTLDINWGERLLENSSRVRGLGGLKIIGYYPGMDDALITFPAGYFKYIPIVRVMQMVKNFIPDDNSRENGNWLVPAVQVLSINHPGTVSDGLGSGLLVTSVWSDGFALRYVVSNHLSSRKPGTAYAYWHAFGV